MYRRKTYLNVVLESRSLNNDRAARWLKVKEARLKRAQARSQRAKAKMKTRLDKAETEINRRTKEFEARINKGEDKCCTQQAQTESG